MRFERVCSTDSSVSLHKFLKPPIKSAALVKIARNWKMKMKLIRETFFFYSLIRFFLRSLRLLLSRKRRRRADHREQSSLNFFISDKSVSKNHTQKREKKASRAYESNFLPSSWVYLVHFSALLLLLSARWLPFMRFNDSLISNWTSKDRNVVTLLWSLIGVSSQF